MAATRTVLKQYFKKYATPTEEQFAALIDAFVHKDEDSLTQSKIDGLTAALESKVSSSDLASAVATAVAETLQGGNIEVTPAAHQHAIADVEGLQAFVNKVNNFLESADVSDETINRWVEIETFLTGITDQETLAGLLLALKNEILAQIPEPQTGNYLKQISDLDAYTEAQVGEIVQYVGTSTADYTRGFCYENKGEGTWGSATTEQIGVECLQYKDSENGIWLMPIISTPFVSVSSLIKPKICKIEYYDDTFYALCIPTENYTGATNNRVAKGYVFGTWYSEDRVSPKNGEIVDSYITYTDSWFDGWKAQFIDVEWNVLFNQNVMYLFWDIPYTTRRLVIPAYYDEATIVLPAIFDTQDYLTKQSDNATEVTLENILHATWIEGGWQPIATSPVVS